MTDIFDKATRSHIMSMIKGANTSPEMIVRKYLHSKGLRYRLHNKKLPGRPDLTLPRYNTVIFVNGCFWHGHKGCKYFKLPKTRTEWWQNKFEKTIIRDKKSKTLLKKIGWKILVIWECELTPKKANKTLGKLFTNIMNNQIDKG